MIEAGFKYIFQNKLYIWKRRQNKISIEERNRAINEENLAGREGVVRLGGNKLRDLAWSLDVLDLNKHIENK